MAVVLIYLVFLFIGFLVLYSIIKAAINHSEMGSIGLGLRSVVAQHSRQHDETQRQLDELKLLLAEQNQLLKEMQTGRP